MRTSGCASVGVITKCMDVHAALGIGIVTGDVPCDRSRGGFVILFESDGSGDLGVSTDGSNYMTKEHGQQRFAMHSASSRSISEV